MKRFEYLDIAKGVGILLVVWGHILLVGPSHRVIYAFHMPLFFLISGMLFKREKFNSIIDFIGKRAKRLLIPFAIYSIVTWLIWATFRFVRHDNVVSYWDPLLQTIIAKGSGAYMVHNSALWFVPCLFATEIIYFTFSKLRPLPKLLIAICCAAISFSLGHFFGDNWWFLLPWNLDAALIGVLFYCLGNVFTTKLPNSILIEFSKSNQLSCWILFLASAALLYWSAMAFGECSMGSSAYNCNGAIFVVRALIGCFACIVLSIFISFASSKNILKKYFMREGCDSLDIMSIHIPIKGIIIMLLAVVLHIKGGAISDSCKYSAIAFIITMIIVDVVVWAIKKGKLAFNKKISSNEIAKS